MKIEHSRGLTTGLDQRSLPNHWQDRAIGAATRVIGKPALTAPARPHLTTRSEPGFNLQLNQQLSALQASDQYLQQLNAALGEVKLGLGRHLAGAITPAEREASLRHLAEAQRLIEARSKATGGSLDANLRLRLTEPARSRVQIDALENLAAVQAAGSETLLFSAGRHFQEPLAITLTEGSSASEILKRFNAALGSESIRVELADDGALFFTMPEERWQTLNGQLRLRGDGKLASKDGALVTAREQSALNLPATLPTQTQAQRQLLDQVVSTSGQISALRETINQRQRDVQSFLAEQPHKDDGQWAEFFIARVNQLSTDKAQDFALLGQLVGAQSHISRATVVSLLS